ncbi:BlaI/MecI/CopY family transcriptional regulator [Streptomyces sp. DSM 116494]|uniref:BlaI/MecI/CopY family transcriptional regulator n=1 Tax=Streptomyces okerensis TaxID=3344655 RepID=UPI00388ECDF4
MSESTTASHDLASQYAAQVTSDLERNLKEQERISAEIILLQQELAALQQNHAVLVNMQQALGLVPAPAQSTAVTDSPAVPSPRKKTAAPSKKTPKTSAGRPGRKKTEKPASRKKTAPAAPTAQPTLVDLVRGHLAEQSEPRSAAEITTALSQAHSERTVKATVVRTTLEGLVAKSQAQRTTQGRSVYYTATQPSQDTSEPQADAQRA